MIYWGDHYIPVPVYLSINCCIVQIYMPNMTGRYTKYGILLLILSLTMIWRIYHFMVYSYIPYIWLTWTKCTVSGNVILLHRVNHSKKLIAVFSQCFLQRFLRDFDNFFAKNMPWFWPFFIMIFYCPKVLPHQYEQPCVQTRIFQDHAPLAAVQHVLPFPSMLSIQHKQAFNNFWIAIKYNEIKCRTY